MIGDRLIIKDHHTGRARDIVEILEGRIRGKFGITVAGESGSGKSETASEIARLLIEKEYKVDILQQDDYFVFPPKTNHEMRRRNLMQVGMYEVKLDLLDGNMRSFKRGESPIFKPLVIYNANQMTTEEMDVADLDVLVAEGTYTTTLQYADFRVFIDRDYHKTMDARKERARDKFEPFVADVLEIEHKIISQHRYLADVIITHDFENIIVQEPRG